MFALSTIACLICCRQIRIIGIMQMT